MSRKGAEGPPEQPNALEPQEEAGPPPLDLTVAKLTDTGRSRPHNEDSVDFFIPPDVQQQARKGAMYLAADGMGGHSAGEVASHTATELLIGHYYSDTTHDIGTSLVRAFRLANRAIYEQSQSDPTKSGMGTTLVAAVVLGRKVYVANVGDSRAYLINRQGITQITEDHSWVAEQMRAGLLTKEEARRHPQRNVVTRALGTKPSVDVDLFEGEIHEDDILLLCSDGLTGYVEDHELAAITMEHPPEEAVQLLVDQANARGGSDNISAVVVSARKEVVATPTEVAEKPSRAFPLIPILAGLAMVAVVALLGMVVVPRIINPTPAAVAGTPTPTTAVASTGTESVTEIATVDRTVTLVATVEQLTPEVVPPTETFTATEVAVTEVPTSTSEPTSTVAPTYTPTPKPTNTRVSTRRATATETQPTPYPALTLVAPKETDAQSLQGKVTFRWSDSRGLAPGEAYQVLIWREGQVHFGAAEPWQAPEQTINLDEVPHIDQPGDYVWSVVVVDATTDDRLSAEASPWRLTYIGPRETGGSGPEPPDPEH